MQVSFATLPSKSFQPNEDFIAATPEAVVLLDGAGTPHGMESGCVHGVPWFVRRLSIALLSTMTSRSASLASCLAEAIQEVRAMHRDGCDLSHPGSPSATVLALRASPTLEYLVLADSVLILDTAQGIEAITDDREAQVGRRFRAPMDALPGDTPEHEQARGEYIEAMRAHRNRDGGFWVASVTPEAADQALTGTVDQADARTALLFSDGASRLVDRFDLASWQDAVKIASTEGPIRLLHEVRRVEESDPAGERWPRGKVYDDASAAYCSELH